MPTCRSPAPSSTIDLFSRLIGGVAVDTKWEVKPHRPEGLKIKAEALSLRQLIHRSHQKLPHDPPCAPTPHPAEWRGALAHAAQAVAHASLSSACRAWRVLSKTWGHFVDVAEVELCIVLGVEPRELGERSRTIKAYWAS
eukprot:668774-Pyramimonas_sp.AAC.1